MQLGLRAAALALPVQRQLQQRRCKGTLRRNGEVHVGQTDVLGDTSARLSADAGQRPLKRDRPGREHPSICAGCAMVAPGAKLAAAMAMPGRQRGDRRNLRSRSTRNCALGMTTSSCVGSTLQAREECGPACDSSSARDAGDK